MKQWKTFCQQEWSSPQPFSILSNFIDCICGWISSFESEHRSFYIPPMMMASVYQHFTWKQTHLRMISNLFSLSFRLPKMKFSELTLIKSFLEMILTLLRTKRHSFSSSLSQIEKGISLHMKIRNFATREKTSSVLAQATVRKELLQSI